MIRAPDYDALVRDLKALEQEWRGLTGEAEAKQAVADAAIAQLRSIGVDPYHEGELRQGGCWTHVRPDFLGAAWGMGGPGDGFAHRIHQIVRKHVTDALLGREQA